MIQHCLGGSFLENTPFCKGMLAVLPYSGTLVRISDCIYPGSDAEFPVCHCSCPCVYLPHKFHAIRFYWNVASLLPTHCSCTLQVGKE
jgi:hypothetical protein